MGKKIVSEKRKKAAHSYYIEALEILNESKIPYLLAGTFALNHYTGINRNTKDLDIFCKEVDYVEKILKISNIFLYMIYLEKNTFCLKINLDDLKRGDFCFS